MARSNEVGCAVNVTGLTYFLSVCFWVLTAFYGVISSQAFIQEQFLAPRLFAPLSAFADWQPAIAIGVFAAWSVSRLNELARLRSKRSWAAAIVWLAATATIALGAPLSSRMTTSASLMVVGLGVVMILLLALVECRAFREVVVSTAPDRSRADLTACVLAALGVTAIHVGAVAWFGGLSAALLSDGLNALRLHLLLAAGAFLTLSAVRGAAALTSRPSAVEAFLSVTVLAGALSAFVSLVMLASISIRGSLAIAMGLGLGIAITCAVAARGTAETDVYDGVTRVLAALSPKIVAHGWGFTVWVAGLLAFAIGATAASRTVDWNFLLLRTSVVVGWLLALSAALTFSRRVSNGGARAAFASGAVLLGAHLALKATIAPVQASTLQNASARWIAQMLVTEAPARDAGDLVGLLHANTNIPRDTQVEAVDVELATLAGEPSAIRPHVFVFVVDSLRRDYLSPYNPAVTFTPGVAALAQDSLVFQEAFTQYGATGLSVPSIWVGGQVLHKQYVSSFPRMNALAKLLAHEKYEQWLSMDHILDVILPPSESRLPLDAGAPVKTHRLCSTLAQIRSRLSGRLPADPPVFAYSLPQDVHVSVVTSEGARPVDQGDYRGFYAPVASRVRRFEQCRGEFLNDLKAQGLYDQSVIILTSDHGDSLGEEGRMGHAYSLHPEIVRVPLIVHVPPALRSAWTWDEKRVAYITDITPTLYRLLGHEPTQPAPFFGVPLALRVGVSPPQQTTRMVAASYGAVYGVLLAHATRYYVFDAVSMRDMAFELGTGATAGVEVPMTSDVQEQGLKTIRETIGAIGAFYRFSKAPGSAP